MGKGKIVHIALTGGPCGGKSTSISRIEQELSDRGYKVITISEMATRVITSGINPINVGTIPFQKLMISLMQSENDAYEQACNHLAENDQTVIVVHDRGIPDCKAFMDDEDYLSVLKSLGLNETNVLDFYDGVFNLVTAADGAAHAYTLENNAARSETPEQAIARDRDCIKAWTGHSHLRIITNTNKNFDEKIDCLMKEVYSLLGVPAPTEIERKFLIEMPDMTKIRDKYDCTTVNIVQTYLVEKEKGTERRIRLRGANGEYTFYYTEKTKIDEISRIEKERKISESEYLKLMLEADTKLHQIVKERTCFVYNGLYFELDVYPFWDNKAILEIELTDANQEIDIPEYIKVIKEVTDDDRYKNNSLAKNLGNIE